jgi:hypothetical protein
VRAPRGDAAVSMMRKIDIRHQLSAMLDVEHDQLMLSES